MTTDTIKLRVNPFSFYDKLNPILVDDIKNDSRLSDTLLCHLLFRIGTGFPFSGIPKFMLP